MAKKSAGLGVLVVADEFLMRWAITESLTESGYAAVEAGDGAGAIRALTEASSSIDVVILDYQLAGSDGAGCVDERSKNRSFDAGGRDDRGRKPGSHLGSASARRLSGRHQAV